MAIKTDDFKKFCEAAHEVLPKLAPLVKVDYFYYNLSYIREQDKVIEAQFETWTLYFRQKMDKFESAREMLIEMCGKSDVEIVWTIPADIKDFGQSTWEKYRKFDSVTRFFYEGVEITKLIKA